MRPAAIDGQAELLLEFLQHDGVCQFLLSVPRHQLYGEYGKSNGETGGQDPGQPRDAAAKGQREEKSLRRHAERGRLPHH